MRVWLLLPHGQHGIEQQHALGGPRLEETMIRDAKSGHVCCQLLVHIDEARRGLDALLDTEAQPCSTTIGMCAQQKPQQTMALPRPVVGVLPDNHHLDVVHTAALRPGIDLIRCGQWVSMMISCKGYHARTCLAGTHWPTLSVLPGTP